MPLTYTYVNMLIIPENKDRVLYYRGDNCTDGPCANGGLDTCSSIGSYTTGDKCKDIITDGVGHYECLCQTGWSGIYCDRKSGSLCAKNKANCVYNMDQYLCYSTHVHISISILRKNI